MVERGQIDECFEPHFFESNFWLMWASMFGFETWHSAAELRRDLLRFLRLFPDRVGDFVPKTMAECSGREILVELYSHLGFQDDLPALLAHANCIPCLLPYTTSQFMPRRRGDRPPVIPDLTAQLAVVGQYCEIPHNVVYTVEYSVHSALLAVSALLDLGDDEVPPIYVGLDHPNALVDALRRVLQ